MITSPEKLVAAIIAAIACVGSTAPAMASPVTAYTATPLGPINPVAINDAGQVAGTIGINGVSHAALWSNGKTIDLGTLGGPLSWALGMNDLGDVVGGSDIPGGDPLNPFAHPFLYSQGAMHDLGTLGGPIGVAVAINNHGLVVGGAEDSQYRTSSGQPFVSGPNDLLALADHTPTGGSANAINNQGQIAGTLNHHAFFFDGTTLHDLGTLSTQPHATSEAHGINSAGAVVGWSGTDDFPAHAFLFAAGKMADLGTLGGVASYANGINDLGQVVGYSYYNTSYLDNVGDHAFLYEDGHMIDLNDFVDTRYWSLNSATGINDAGQIVGIGQGPGGVGGFLLTPVPEPAAASLLLLLAGAASLRRQR